MKTLAYIILGLIGLADYLTAEIVKLSWDANPVAEKITSYKINYGTAANALTKSLIATGTTASTPDLAPGVYFFSIQAVNQNGVSSAASPAITHTSLATPSIPTTFKIVIEGTVTLIPLPPNP